MTKKYKEVINELYESYSFVEEDLNKFKSIALDKVPNGLTKEELMLRTKSNIIKYIIDIIKNKKFSSLFNRTVDKMGIEKTLELYDMIIEEADIEIEIEDILLLSSNEKYQDYYKSQINAKTNNYILKNILEILEQEEDTSELDEQYISNVTDDQVHDYLREIRNIPVLTREEEIELIKKYRETNDSYYKDEFIAHNLRLAAKIAFKFRRQNQDIKLTDMDLIQEGNIGLIRAFEKFDETLGFKFSTYACPWISQKISRAIENQNDTIRIPAHMNEKIRKIIRFVDKYTTENGERPTDEVIMASLNITAKEYKKIEEAANIKTPLSIDFTVETDDSKRDRASSLSSFLKDEKTSNVEDVVISNYYKDQLIDYLDRILTEKEKIVILDRYGVNDFNEALTLKEIGDKLHITRERVRQIEAKAIKKLQSKSHLIEDNEDMPSKRLLSKEDLQAKLKAKNMNSITVLQYRTKSKNSVFKCSKCNSNFSYPPLDLLNEGKCPNCKEKQKVYKKI